MFSPSSFLLSAFASKSQVSRRATESQSGPPAFAPMKVAASMSPSRSQHSNSPLESNSTSKFASLSSSALHFGIGCMPTKRRVMAHTAPLHCISLSPPASEHQADHSSRLMIDFAHFLHIAAG
eukprot:7304083-Pyramimonas_sp.AAC.2